MKPERIRIRIVCNECGHAWYVSPDADPQCAECNSVDFDVPEENPRVKGDDDGQEYADPRDFLAYRDDILDPRD